MSGEAETLRPPVSCHEPAHIAGTTVCVHAGLALVVASHALTALLAWAARRQTR